ncbi:hypothetical protein G5V59_25975 [Nocardioides sp. W3-2-3]|nr:hypothetical protein [Nocardioides convexus]
MAKEGSTSLTPVAMPGYVSGSPATAVSGAANLYVMESGRRACSPGPPAPRGRAPEHQHRLPAGCVAACRASTCSP